MVKVKDEQTAMVEPPKTSNKNNNNNTTYAPPRKPRQYHHHPSYYHHYHHHHCTLPQPLIDTSSCEHHAVNGCSANGTPTKFHFGPGFEAQSGTALPTGNFPSQINGEYVVLFHVNPGVTISFQMGDTFEILRGPVTVPMVSTNSSPPIAMPVQVPPGHVVQQIVDESGTLRHVILSTQHPPALLPLSSHNQPHYGGGPPNGTTPQPQAYHYPQGLPPGYPTHHHPHYHPNIPPGTHQMPPHPPGHSPPPPNFYKDERTQRQYFKLKKKLHDKQQNKGESGGGPGGARKELVNGLRRGKEKGMNSVGTSEDGEESSSVQDEEDSVNIITEMLSSVKVPEVSELNSRSALLQWAAPPLRLSEASSNDSHELDISENDLRYEVLLSDKIKDKYKSIYSGPCLSCRIEDLRPGVEYSVRLQVHLDELQGSASDALKFTTPMCEPDQPQAPKLISRTKNTLQLRWNAVNDNGANIQFYILEYDDGKGGDFMELHKSRGKQHTLAKLAPATSYKFRLAASNEVGRSVYSDEVSFTTSDNAPAQPVAPVLEKASINSLQLSWNKRPKDEDFTLHMNDPRYGFMAVYNGRDCEYNCMNLKRFSDYTFRLRANNEGGQSVWSEEITFQTLPDRPARPSKPIVKGRIHAHSFRLKWEPPVDTGGAEISNYFLEVNSGSGYTTVYTGSETEAICDKLTPGTTYQLRVSCDSIGGTSNYSDPCTVTTDAIAPGQCAIPRTHGKPRATSAILRFVEPDYNGGAPVLEYEVEMLSVTNNSWSSVHKSKETECTVSDLQPGCEYRFMVRAVNRVGPGAYSDLLMLTSGAAPPDAPTTPLITCKSPFNIFVTWAEPPCNGAPISEYRLEMSAENDEAFVAIYQGATLSHDIKGLNPHTKYYCRIQAANHAGFGSYSATAETLTSASAPNVVQTPKCDSSTPTSITLYWHEPANNGAPITHYVIECGEHVINTDGPVNEYTIESLQPETHYKIKCQAVNEKGAGSYSSTLKATTLRLPPVAPRLECIGIGHNYLKLKWGEGKNADYTQYTIEMENKHDFQIVFKGTAFTCKVNKLQELTAYRFRICACNDAGVGDYSDEYEFTTNIAPPAALKAPKCVEVDQKCCSLEWLVSRNNNSDRILYAVQVSRLKEQQYKQMYKGSETKCTLENLESGAEYSARVCPIRVTQSGELLSGPFSPSLTFTTLAPDTNGAGVSKASTSHTGATPIHSHKSKSLLQTIWPKKKHMTDQQMVFIWAICIGAIGVLIALFISKVM